MLIPAVLSAMLEEHKTVDTVDTGEGTESRSDESSEDRPDSDASFG